MVEEGDTAPDFTAPLANGDVEPFSLSDNVENAPLVLAFFPGAFTSTCNDEMSTFQAELDTYDEIGATVYGVSVDTPFSLNEYREKFDLTFGIISDHTKEIIDAYDVQMDYADKGYFGVAKRAVFVVDEDRTVTYKSVEEDASNEPDYEEIKRAAVEAAR